MKKISSFFYNKYVLVTAFFVVWMLFIDQRDVFYVLQQKHQLQSLQLKKQYYEQQIKLVQIDLDNLQHNPAAIEKFAREKYLMKKPNEDVFIVEGDVFHN
ncbi:MAG: septum formation initiator family protein [Sphingobacteriales bacterium]|uniref:FtsB family cell division protein n=1 Tax=Hydrotalea flava TaxID=714549 RepID=UPI00082B6C47|nr:septum formation initiator family protein [Hydrotalea flava]RTL47268.1 MAG: septum formation initiator family protein [Sphingobacteriales bacterium]